MIVHPGFQRHFKTRKLIKLTGSEVDPLKLQLLWEYCQYKRSERLHMSVGDLAVQCEWDGDPKEWYSALQESRWIEEEGENDQGEMIFVVHEWSEHNKNWLQKVAASQAAAEERARRAAERSSSKAVKDTSLVSSSKSSSVLSMKAPIEEKRIEEKGIERKREINNTPLTPRGGSRCGEDNNLLSQICSLYGRSLTSRWVDKELALAQEVMDRADFAEEMELLRRLKKEPTERVVEWRCQLRHRLGVGLRDWTGECDKARRYFELARERDNDAGGPVIFGL